MIGDLEGHTKTTDHFTEQNYKQNFIFQANGQPADLNRIPSRGGSVVFCQSA